MSSRTERRDRQAQIELLREQREDERRDRDEQRRADLHAEQGPPAGGERSDAYEMRVTNLCASAPRAITPDPMPAQTRKSTSRDLKLLKALMETRPSGTIG